MAQTENLEETSTTVTRATPVAVLFADIAGSTKLYEDHGDDVARAAVAVCIQVLTDVVERFDGRVLKTIGDEVMCAFRDPSNALTASSAMQFAVQDAGEAGKFVTGPCVSRWACTMGVE